MTVSKIAALLLFPAYLAAIAILAYLQISATFESDELLLIFNILFIGLIPIAISFLAARVYMKSGSRGFLLVGCGMLTFGLSSMLAAALRTLPDGPNILVTIHNSGVFACAVFQFIGGMLFIVSGTSWNKHGKESWSVIGAYGSVVVLTLLFSLVTVLEYLPRFFIQGSGPTALRQFVLITAMNLYVISSALFMIPYRKLRSEFLYWYVLSLGMISIGLFAIFFQQTVGSPIGWLGRSAQYLGGLFGLIAVLSATSSAFAGNMSLEQAIVFHFGDAESSYKNVVEMANDGIITFDQMGRIIGWNSAAERMFDISKSEAIGSIFFNLIIPGKSADDLKAHVESLSKSSSKSVTKKALEIEARRNDGTSFPVESSLSLREAPGGWLCSCICRDISNRRRGEEQLRQSDEKYRLIFNTSPVGMMHFNSDGIITDCNEKLLEILGASREQVIGFNLMTSVTSEDVKGAVKSALSGRVGTYEGEYTSITGGRTVWGRIVYTPLTTPGGVLSGGIAIVEDLTDRKLAEESLHSSEERFRLIAETIKEVFWMTDIETGTTFYVSPTYEHVWGRSLESLYQKPKSFVDSIHEEDRERVLTSLEVKKSGKQFEQEYRIIRPDGTVRWISDRGFPVQNQPWKVARYVGVAQDITNRKRAEEELRNSEAKYRRIVDTANEGIWTIDESLVITFSNNMMAEMLGYTVEEVVGKKLEDFIFEEDLEDHRQKIKDRRRGLDSHFERRLPRKDGTVLWTRVSATSVMNREGDFSGAFAMYTDISHEKALEAQLLQSQKMQTVGTLAAGIAHDFNNMLQVILGYSDMLLNDRKKGEPGHEQLQKIVKTALEARDLVQKIRIFSKQADVKLVPMDLNHQIDEVTKLLSHTLPITIDIDILLTEDPAIIKADPALMDQMVMNLAINAGEAMPDGGTLTIQTQNTLLDDDFCLLHVGVKPGPHVVLTVSDTGRGMSKVLIDKIFDPFFTTKQRDYHRGTGLGLSVVQGIVEQHSGCVTVDSDVGKGTTFRIYFPVLIDKEVPEVVTKIELSTGGTETILLVEDMELVRDLAVIILEKFGYTVLSAGDGQEALDVYEKEQGNISLVILDIIMPRMDGKQCLEQLLRINPTVKVIISSGVGQEDLIQDVVKLGAKGAVNKPYSMRQLLGIVREVLDGD